MMTQSMLVTTAFHQTATRIGLLPKKKEIIAIMVVLGSGEGEMLRDAQRVPHHSAPLPTNAREQE
eukprot:m.102389 g.102389  ORF g.102389 m.102389 type:complete len:65 (-) comp16819_c0_seq1:863-1057(-)